MQYIITIISSSTILFITHFSRSAAAAAFSKSTATSTNVSFYSTRRSFKMSTNNVNTNLRNPHKRMKTTSSSSLSFPISTKTIATHNGTFQADEALGVWLLRQTSEYYQSKVIRTRDESVYSKADIVIDVGGVYEHPMKKYDHHQRDYDERFDDKVDLVVESTSATDTNTNTLVEKKIPRITKLSASGLVYRHYGKEVIQNIYPTLSNKDLDLVYTKMYNSFMEAIDAIDTGVEPLPKGCAIELQYRDSTGLSSRVSRLNPRWNDDDDINPDDRFEDASALCGDDFMSVLTSIVESTLPARTFVEQAVVTRFNIDPSGQIIKFESGGLPWKSHLYDLEKEHNLVQYKDLIKFVLYTDQSGMWRIQAVTVEGQAFENRLSLPEHWRGVRDADLEKVAGIAGCTFCHAAGFIGGNKSFEGVLQMARVALQQMDEEMK